MAIYCSIIFIYILFTVYLSMYINLYAYLLAVRVIKS